MIDFEVIRWLTHEVKRILRLGRYEGPEIDRKLLIAILGNDASNLASERRLEKNLRKRLLEADGEFRRSLYTHVYDTIYDFFQQHGYMGHRSDVATLRMWTFSLSYIAKVIGSGRRCLEVGCGDGLFSLAIGLKGNEAVGIDISDKQLTLARSYQRLLGLKNVRFMKMAATKLRFPSSSFHCSISRDVIEHLHPEDAHVHLLEIKRVLKPGGFYIITTPNKLSGHRIPLHLKEYSYEDLLMELKTVGYNRFRAPLLFEFSPFNLVTRVEVKVALERLYSLFQLSGLPWTLLGLDKICIIAYRD